VIVAGGFDVANYKPLRHGSAYRPFQRNLIRYALENASMVLPVSKFNQGELLRFARPQRHRMIYNGLDLDIHAPLTPFQDRKHQIVTVGAVDRHYSKLKGHPQFAKLAANFNQAQFILIGPIKDIEYKKHLDQIAQGRITFAGEKSHDDVIRCFQESRIYLQLSLYESFGLTVPEAMACGCIPVVSANGALPEVVGPVGEIHEPDDHQSILNTLHTCIQSPPRELEVYHKQAMHFAPHIRRQELLEAVHEILSSRPR